MSNNTPVEGATAAGFASYIIVDWSGAAVPCRGADSIWFAAFTRSRRALRRVALENPPTRAAATERLAALIAILAARGRVLVGFDFPFGYGAGTAAALVPHEPSWRGLWMALAAAIRDGDGNDNNRFELAESWNRRLSGAAFPFWGTPRNGARPLLGATKPRPHGAGDMPERRFCELRMRRTQPVWKLAYTGSVGSQALLGIPRVWQLRRDPRLEAISAIWPFETGLADDPAKRVVFAEVYPSLVAPETIAGKPKDAGQVTALARHFARLDARGALAALFAADPALSVDERGIVVAEEAWILGVTGARAR